MRAVVLEEPGSEPALRDYPEPDDHAARVVAAGVNPVDLVMAGPMFDSYLPFPRVLGMEAVVERDGVLSYCESTVPPWGSFAEQTAAPVDGLVPLPPGLDPLDALALGVAGLAGWLSVQAANVERGDTVVVLGATGAVGQIAVQAARLAGAERVVAVGRHRPTLERLRQMGAHESITVDECMERGVDLRADVFIAAKKFGLDALARHAAPTARVVDIGAPPRNVRGDAIAPLAHAPDLEVVPYNNFDYEIGDKRAAFLAMAALVIEGRLEVNVEAVALDDALAAWRRQEQSPHCKLVLVP